MLYLLDTNIASHIIKGDIPRVRERLVAVPIERVAVSVITQAELLYGVAKRGHPHGLTARVREFLARVTILPWGSGTAETYGELRAACERIGITLSPMDMMIAAHAKHLMVGQTVLVTRDKAFSLVSGLVVEDWTAVHGGQGEHT
ncbi:type II toxin-antitoxin system VapC family toxin [Acidithiobacillus sp. IBUN Pt1247-S3]|uniref:type II toxin-antitoxin system VapC family toxin n=1 Tax=Acidithiobacillus sp. IBUN Pt1247-S3 TaxID=3166642 RepID=UPI0034E3B674